MDDRGLAARDVIRLENTVERLNSTARRRDKWLAFLGGLAAVLLLALVGAGIYIEDIQETHRWQLEVAIDIAEDLSATLTERPTS